MDIATILMAVGIFLIILSFFFKDRSKKIESELEDLSINIYQETNGIKRRLKMVEEELLLEPNFQVKAPNATNAKTEQALQAFNQAAQQMKVSQATTQMKPINSILVSQVKALNEQGLSIEEISKRSTLSHAQIEQILGGAL